MITYSVQFFLALGRGSEMTNEITFSDHSITDGDTIRAAPTVADINDTAWHFGWHVERLKREGGAARTMAIQIQNLAAYRRQQIQETG